MVLFLLRILGRGGLNILGKLKIPLVHHLKSSGASRFLKAITCGLKRKNLSLILV